MHRPFRGQHPTPAPRTVNARSPVLHGPLADGAHSIPRRSCTKSTAVVAAFRPSLRRRPTDLYRAGRPAVTLPLPAKEDWLHHQP
jgi:hypothetical protein